LMYTISLIPQVGNVSLVSLHLLRRSCAYKTFSQTEGQNDYYTFINFVCRGYNKNAGSSVFFLEVSEFVPYHVKY